MTENASNRFRVGLVGTGGIARAHGGACKLLDEVALAAVCDVSPEALQRFGDEFGVMQRYTDLATMLDEVELDIAVICNWGVHHASTGIQLAQSKRVRAILCEKPFTSNAAEAQALVDAAAVNGVLLAEAFKFRHHPMHLQAKAMIEAGAIGELMSIRSTFCTGGNGDGPEMRQPSQNWRFNKSQGGGSIYDLACYCIHHARFMFDEEPLRVFATRQPGIEVDDGASVLMEFSRGRSAQITVSFGMWDSQYAEMAGSKGLLRIDKAWNNENMPVSLKHWSLPEHRSEPKVIDYPPINQFALQLQHLCACLRDGTPHRIPPANSIAQMRVIDAIFVAMASGQSVTLPR